MTMTAQQLREKISAWLSDKTNHEGDLVDFLVDKCGVVYEDKWVEQDRPIEETIAACKCCDNILTDDDIDRGTGECEYCEEMMKDEDEGDMNMDTPNYKQKIEDACPVGHTTVWGDHGFIYEEVEKCIKCGTTEKLRDYHLSWPRPSGIVKTCFPCARIMAKEFVHTMLSTADN